MTAALKLVSVMALVLTVGPAFLVFVGIIAWSTHATVMAVGTLLWFGTAPFWMNDGEPGT